MESSYAQNDILTASPVKLRGLILERSVLEARRLSSAIDSGDGEAIVQSGNLLRSLVLELLTSVSAAAAPELKRALEQTYLFLVQRIGEACGRRDAVAAAEVVDLLGYERETWRRVTAQMRADASGPSPGEINLAG